MGCAHVWMMSVGVVEQRFVERFVLTTVLQRTMTGSEDKVTNHEHCSKFYFPDKRFLDIERNQCMVYK